MHIKDGDDNADRGDALVELAISTFEAQGNYYLFYNNCHTFCRDFTGRLGYWTSIEAMQDGHQ